MASLKNELSDSARMESIYLISIWSSSPSDKINYANDLMDLATSRNNDKYIEAALISLGTAYRLIGNLDKALEYLIESARLAETNKSFKRLAEAYGEIATVHSSNSDFRNALKYNQLSADLFLSLGDNISYALSTLNAANQFYRIGVMDSSFHHYSIAEQIFEDSEFEFGIAYVVGNRAIAKLAMGLTEEAEVDFKRAIDILDPLGDNYGIADFQNELGKVYVERGDDEKAIETISKGLEIAKKIDLKAQIRDASDLLSTLHQKNGEFEKALSYHKQFVAYKDSIQNTETVRKLANQRTEFEIGQAEAAMAAERQTQLVVNVALIFGLGLLTVFGIAQYRNSRQRMRINKELRDQKTELETQKSELEAVNRTKDRFFSIISHDLRGPVNAFHGVSRMIKFFVQNKQIDQLEVLAEEIDQSVDRLSSLLDNLLNWAVQQQGEFPYVPEKIEIKAMSDDLVDVFTTMANSKQINLSSSVPEDLHAWADRNTTMTIIRNLVSNALKFTPREGHVTINARSLDECVEIEVHDNGVGIPKEKLGHLFELNEENSTWGTEGEKGLGLGLQLVHEFVELNQGQIIVDSQDNKGTTFTVKLPTYDLKQIQAEVE
ncbi:MAG: tetratricopeptide repeat-containing sensor histidine kinase [Cytophagales bacterium]|nr:tetratricopeptide repeat-containing sensor histidine kinase [Cytophagales bacterium]